MKTYTAIALEHFPMVKPGDDIALQIVEIAKANNVDLEDGDVVVIAQKIISKAEKRIVHLKNVQSSQRASKLAKEVGRSSKIIELVLRETRRILKLSRDIVLVEDKRGLICINAGLDKSNVKGADAFALLPENPDKSAQNCRTAIKKLTNKNVAVIVCDTYSRPFRRGQVNFAIGVAGVKPFKDYRGKKDLFGQVLKVKNIAVIDEIAAAAELLMGQATEARPVVIFKGLKEHVDRCENCSISELFISRKEDLFKNAL
ncbi:MAG: coenzyme F420-0:L-glutamate ligase [Candidatus Bathyarchaeota archaeon]|nr:coenzyme F420-0:L-glutamate ligase [Candidatus Bathyarchaeota archaeon]